MHRRGSMEKYIHRASTAAEEFRAAELEWLQNEALGAPLFLEEVTQTLEKTRMARRSHRAKF